MYRKIPGQTIPQWMINNNYKRLTPEGYVNLPSHTLRKNDLGLIGVYDIYQYPAVDLNPSLPGVIGQVNFGPATDANVNAFSMYLVGVKPL
jgi:hypothetical protein